MERLKVCAPTLMPDGLPRVITSSLDFDWSRIAEPSISPPCSLPRSPLLGPEGETLPSWFGLARPVFQAGQAPPALVRRYNPNRPQGLCQRITLHKRKFFSSFRADQIDPAECGEYDDFPLLAASRSPK